MARTKQEIAEYKYNWAQSPACKEQRRQFRVLHPEANKGNVNKRTSHLKTRYGITDNDYYAILAGQGGGCAICKSIVPNNGKGDAFFDVDHDHVTGKVRGLLCRDCNVTVGVIEKKHEKIILIREYLEFHVEADRVKEQKFMEKKA